MLSLFFLLVTSQLYAAEFRIVSLDLASSETMVALNLNTKIIAVDTLSKKLPTFVNIPPVASGLKVDWEKIITLMPTHIVAYDLGFSDIERQSKKLGIKSIILKNKHMKDLIRNVETLENAFDLTNSTSIRIKKELEAFSSSLHATYFLQIDYSPTYLVGQNTFLADALSMCGLRNPIDKNGYILWQRELYLQQRPHWILIMDDVIKKHGQETIFNYWKKWHPTSKIKVIAADAFSRLSPYFLEKVKLLCSELQTNDRI